MYLMFVCPKKWKDFMVNLVFGLIASEASHLALKLEGRNKPSQIVRGPAIYLLYFCYFLLNTKGAPASENNIRGPRRV